jgi:hypothetical protein
MEFIFKHGWIMIIPVLIINYLMMKSQIKEYADRDPGLKQGYNKIFKALFIYGSIPWIIMAIGDVTTFTHSVFDYFNPKSLNPFVLMFHASIIVIWILSCRWMYFKGGADFLVRHPGLVRIRGFGHSTIPTPGKIKIFFALALAGGIIGMTMMWIMDIPAFPAK